MVLSSDKEAQKGTATATKENFSFWSYISNKIHTKINYKMQHLFIDFMGVRSN